jgi:hypothetical protein
MTWVCTAGVGGDDQPGIGSYMSPQLGPSLQRRFTLEPASDTRSYKTRTILYE